MRSLYLKILGWFLVTIVLSLGLFVVIARSAADRGVRQKGNPFARMQALQLNDAREAFEAGGSAALERYLQKLQKFMGAEHYLLDSRGRDLATGEDRSALLADAPSPNARFVTSGERTVFIRSTPDGKYHLVVSGPPPFSPWTFAPWFLPVLALVALLCWVLAITIASPLRRMAAAVDRFGGGDLGVRLHLRRRDEIGDLARTFDTMADRIQTLMTAERRLLQDVSHELRSPLARLSFAAELVKTAPDRTVAMGRLQKEIGRLTELVSALLQMTRAEGDPAERRSESIALSQLVADIAEDSRIEAAARGCTVSSDIEAGLSLAGDAELVRRAIENVVRNAVRYSPAGESVEIAASCQRDTTRVVVRDYGPGVPEHSLSKIFSPFFRVDDSRNSDTGGAGLGLAIAARAVQLHSGTITAENASPGLRVTIEFPVCAPDPRPAIAPDAVAN